jgi:hypothetical protein
MGHVRHRLGDRSAAHSPSVGTLGTLTPANRSRPVRIPGLNCAFMVELRGFEPLAVPAKIGSELR